MINGRRYQVEKDGAETLIAGMPLNAFVDWLKENDPIGYQDVTKLGAGITDGSIHTPSGAMKEYRQQREN